MTDRNRLNAKEYGEDGVAVDDNECESEKNCTQFSIENEEAMNEDERERWSRKAKKYEELIDRLFDDN